MVYFANIAAFRKAITPKRVELLQCIKKHNPTSIRHLWWETLMGLKRTLRNYKHIGMPI